MAKWNQIRKMKKTLHDLFLFSNNWVLQKSAEILLMHFSSKNISLCVCKGPIYFRLNVKFNQFCDPFVVRLHFWEYLHWSALDSFVLTQFRTWSTLLWSLMCLSGTVPERQLRRLSSPKFWQYHLNGPSNKNALTEWCQNDSLVRIIDRSGKAEELTPVHPASINMKTLSIFSYFNGIYRHKRFQISPHTVLFCSKKSIFAFQGPRFHHTIPVFLSFPSFNSFTNFASFFLMSFNNNKSLWLRSSSDEPKTLTDIAFCTCNQNQTGHLIARILSC